MTKSATRMRCTRCRPRFTPRNRAGTTQWCCARLSAFWDPTKRGRAPSGLMPRQVWMRYVVAERWVGSWALILYVYKLLYFITLFWNDQIYMVLIFSKRSVATAAGLVRLTDRQTVCRDVSESWLGDSVIRVNWQISLTHEWLESLGKWLGSFFHTTSQKIFKHLATYSSFSWNHSTYHYRWVFFEIVVRFVSHDSLWLESRLGLAKNWFATISTDDAADLK